MSKKKWRIRKEKAEINNIKNEKPYMSVKSVERFQVFKEHIRKNLHENEEYLFSKKHQKRNGNHLIVSRS
jgi:hypothetical protein